MNTIAGCPFSETSLALVNSWETFLSDSPSHFDIREAASAQKNIPLISLAMAAARSVFPQPGGPKKSIPRGHPRGNRSGLRTGQIIDSSIALFGLSRSAMSLQLMSGFSVRTHWSSLMVLESLVSVESMNELSAHRIGVLGFVSCTPLRVLCRLCFEARLGRGSIA